MTQQLPTQPLPTPTKPKPQTRPKPLPYGLCGRCDGIDVVRDVTRPLCRVCDPDLAALLAARARAAGRAA